MRGAPSCFLLKVSCNSSGGSKGVLRVDKYLGGYDGRSIRAILVLIRKVDSGAGRADVWSLAGFVLCNVYGMCGIRFVLGIFCVLFIFLGKGGCRCDGV